MGSTLYSKRFKWTEGRKRLKRPKTFCSEESAKKWADTHNIKSYELVNLHLGSGNKKIRIVAKVLEKSKQEQKAPA
jgi:hypothetical protein